MSNVTEITSDSFDQDVTQADLPVLVDFYAPWCGPCKMISPMLDALAGNYAGKVKFAKVNVDEAAELAQKFSVTGVPTLVLMRNGEVVDTIVGLASQGALKEKLDTLTEAK
jgi:thioredoxin 1